jgi:hypothetical protein
VDVLGVIDAQHPGPDLDRVVRLLRVLKLLKFLPQLAVIVNALLMALSSIGYILLILFLTYYLYAVLGIIFFRENDKGNFGTLTRALVALYKMATLDNWGLIMYANIYGCDQYPSQKNYNSFPTRKLINSNSCTKRNANEATNK